MIGTPLDLSRIERGQQRETNSLSDVDAAVGNYLATALNGIIVTSASGRYDNLRAFLERPLREQIIMASFDEPRRLLRRLVAERGHRQPGELLDERGNARALPVVSFSRQPGFSLAAGDDAPRVKHFAELTDDAGETVAMVNKLTVVLQYQISILAWELSSLDRLSMALTSWMQFHPVDFRFTAHVAEGKDSLGGRFIAPGELVWESVSVPDGENRLHALTLPLQVQAEMVEVEAATKVKGTFTMNEPWLALDTSFPSAVKASTCRGCG